MGGERGAKPRLNENNIYIRNQWVFALLNNINNSVLQFYKGNKGVATCILHITKHHCWKLRELGVAAVPDLQKVKVVRRCRIVPALRHFHFSSADFNNAMYTWRISRDVSYTARYLVTDK